MSYEYRMHIMNTSFHRAKVKNVVFIDCDMMNTDFSCAELENVIFIDTQTLAIPESVGEGEKISRVQSFIKKNILRLLPGN